MSTTRNASSRDRLLALVDSSVAQARNRLLSVPWDALGPVRSALETVLGNVLQGAPADRSLTRALRANASWDSSARRVAAEVVFGVSLWRRRLAWVAGVTEAELASRPVVAIDAFVREFAGPEPSEVPFTSIAQALSFPDWLAAHFSRELGEEGAVALMGSLNLPAPITARVNTLRISREELLLRLRSRGLLVRPTSFSPVGLTFELRPNVFGLPEHQEGLFEMQDEGSQLLGMILGAAPHESVLDLCAGAGGKTLLLGNSMQNLGVVHAFDPDFEKLERLERRAIRAGLRNVRTLRALPENLRADRVLVDAPCSSLGSLRRGPDVRFRIGPEVLARDVPTQLEVLEVGARQLSPQGRIVYGTCTINRAENEEIVAAFLLRHREFRVVRPALPSLLCEGDFFKCLPQWVGMDGFFGAVLVR